MFRTAIFLFSLVPVLAAAEDWVPLMVDEEIEAALSDRILRYDALTFQRFGAEGDTQFITERASDGRWAARGGQYCSVWPPSDVWTCYDFQVSGDQARFISSDRSISVGTFEE